MAIRERLYNVPLDKLLNQGAYRFTCILQSLYFFHSPIQYFPPWAGLRNNKPNYKNQQKLRALSIRNVMFSQLVRIRQD